MSDSSITHPVTIAVIVDNVVKFTMNIDEASSKTFLAQPTFVQVTADSVVSGDTYVDGKFLSGTV